MRLPNYPVYMPQDHLICTFSALADPTRRAILARLAAGEASVTELAKPFDMSLPAVSKHLKVLERADHPWPRGAMAAVPAARQAAERRRRLAGSLSRLVGTEPRSPGGLPERTARQGEAP